MGFYFTAYLKLICITLAALYNNIYCNEYMYRKSTQELLLLRLYNYYFASHDALCLSQYITYMPVLYAQLPQNVGH